MNATLREGTPEEAGMFPERVKLVKALAEGWVADGVTPSLVVLAARRGVIFLHEAYGVLTPEPDSPPLERDSIFPIKSATKPFTAAAVMMLAEDGLVGLVRPVRDYFPEISAEGTEGILIHHLLAHLSGWDEMDVVAEARRRREVGDELPPPARDQHPDVAARLQLACATPLASAPGEAMQYCQFNYELLADLVRRVSGPPIDRFARERIFEPLGMQDSSYVLPPAHRERKVLRAEGFPFSADRSAVAGPFYQGIDSESFEGQPSGAAGMHSSAHDYAVFAQMLLNGGSYGGRRVLSGASVEAMHRSQLPPGTTIQRRVLRDGEPVTLEFRGGYGYGLVPFLGSANAYQNGGLASLSSFGHSGAGGTYWWVDPQRELVGVYLSVIPRFLDDGITGDSRADIFVDTVTAAVAD